MVSLPIWVSAATTVGAVLGIVLARFRLPWARTRRQGAVAAVIALTLVIVVTAGRGRWPAIDMVGFVLLPAAVMLTVVALRGNRVLHRT
jgi:hypothetical protein